MWCQSLFKYKVFSKKLFIDLKQAGKVLRPNIITQTNVTSLTVYIKGAYLSRDFLCFLLLTHHLHNQHLVKQQELHFYTGIIRCASWSIRFPSVLSKHSYTNSPRTGMYKIEGS
jgi:hypothetical protein